MSFTAMPPIPSTGVTQDEALLLAAIVDNLSLLTGEYNSGETAITKGSITVQYNSGSSIPATLLNRTPDTATLVAIIQYLINDVQSLRDTVNTLIRQLNS